MGVSQSTKAHEETRTFAGNFAWQFRSSKNYGSIMSTHYYWWMNKKIMDTALGIIGYPIGHSMSPVFQQAGLDACGVDARYVAYQVAPDEVEAFVSGLRQPGIMGINVTVPHKLAVMPFLDEIDDWATEAGAVNTIVNRQGRLTGHNTDGYGFLRALREGGGLRTAGPPHPHPGGRRRGARRGPGPGPGGRRRPDHRQPHPGTGGEPGPVGPKPGGT